MAAPESSATTAVPNGPHPMAQAANNQRLVRMERSKGLLGELQIVDRKIPGGAAFGGKVDAHHRFGVEDGLGRAESGCLELRPGERVDLGSAGEIDDVDSEVVVALLALIELGHRRFGCETDVHRRAAPGLERNAGVVGGVDGGERFGSLEVDADAA